MAVKQSTGVGAGFSSEMVRVGDLGTFSMEAIYEALSNNARSVEGELHAENAKTQPCEEEDSDCSWTQEEEKGTFYVDIRSQLDSFILKRDQTTMTTPAISRRQRRFVHANAQLLNLGHASLGPQEKFRQMVIFKPNVTATSSSMQTTTTPRIETCVSDLSKLAGTHLLSSPTKKRKRHLKVPNGFPCQYLGCGKRFDRVSERNKHEQSHQVAFTSRFPCDRCDKGFRYPKDLRRHERVHGITAPASTDFQPSSFTSTISDSIITCESRVPSDVSLSFSCKSRSKEASPTLIASAQDRESYFSLDMDPVMLDDENWILSSQGFVRIDEDGQIPDIFDFNFDDIDGSGDRMLEMPKIKK